MCDRVNVRSLPSVCGTAGKPCPRFAPVHAPAPVRLQPAKLRSDGSDQKFLWQQTGHSIAAVTIDGRRRVSAPVIPSMRRPAPTSVTIASTWVEEKKNPHAMMKMAKGPEQKIHEIDPIAAASIRKIEKRDRNREIGTRQSPAVRFVTWRPDQFRFPQRQIPCGESKHRRIE